jgi:nitroimidazol reductase NimA-like FMN-containing flavoprotein (pyridoxamine 5'-phosphate oxidase superfamily)
VNDGPYVVPINYHFSDNCVYSHSLPGSKISALRDNPRACLQVDEIINDVNWRSVLAFGTFEEVHGAAEKAVILNKILEDCPTLTPVESAIAVDGDPPQVIVYRLKISEISGLAEV